jgi:predicted nucleic acid-binding protein
MFPSLIIPPRICQEMLPMHKTIISDTSCFIVLTNIGELHLLQKVYGQILTTPEVAAEYGEVLPEWVAVETVKDNYRQKLLEMQVDKGEASALALALETPDSTVIIDDYRARRVAEKLGLSYTGTVGVMIKAKITGIVVSIKPLLAKMKRTGFRITEDIEQQALREAGE